jgi:hypothetical protein
MMIKNQVSAPKWYKDWQEFKALAGWVKELVVLEASTIDQGR